MSQAVKAPYPQLGKALGDAIGDVSQKELADFCRVHASDISHALKGKRSLPLAALERAAKRLQLDLTLLIQLKTADELRAAGLIVEAEKVQRLASGLTSSQERLFTPESFFQNWRHTLAIENIIAADRREKRPISYADCLALSGSVADLFYLPQMLPVQKARIRSDKIIKIASSDALKRILKSDLLVTSSPSANYATRELLRTTLFPFLTDQETIDAEKKLSDELVNGPRRDIRFNMGALSSFMSDEIRVRELNYMLNGFSKPGFVDPIRFVQARGSTQRGSMDFGIVTLAKNPWAEDRLVVVAAGVRGPATAAALKLLTTEGAFDGHPFGGVFSVTISNAAPWEDRYDLLEPEWDTHSYTIAEYETAIHDSKVIAALPGQRNDGQVAVIELIKRRCSAGSSLS